MSEWPTIHPERPEPPCSGSMGALPCGCCRQLKLANDKLKSIRQRLRRRFLAGCFGFEFDGNLVDLAGEDEGHFVGEVDGGANVAA
jgi:hypothetical protein